MEEVEIHKIDLEQRDSSAIRRFNLNTTTRMADDVVRGAGLKRPAEAKGRRHLAKQTKTVTSTSSIPLSTNSQTSPWNIIAPHTSPGACLTNLPTELLNYIAAYLRKPALFSLSLTNKTLNIVAVPYLFGKGIDPSMSRQALCIFVERTTQHPELAKMVKRIDLAYSMQSGRKTQLLNSILAVATHVERLSVTDDSTEMTKKHRDRDFLWLRILVNAARGTPLVFATGPAETFHKLKTLTITIEAYVRGWLRLKDLSVILSFPSLEDVTLTGFIEGNRITDWGCPARSSNVKRLNLFDCFLHSGAVIQLLESCKKVTHFYYMYSSEDNFAPFSPDSEPGHMWSHHSWKDISSGLRQHEDSLEVLKVFYETDQELIEGARSMGHVIVDPEHLGSLRSFPKLRRITAPIDALVPASANATTLAEWLPDNLESLVVRIDINTRISMDLCCALLGALPPHRNKLKPKSVRVSVGNETNVAGLKHLDAIVMLSAIGANFEATCAVSHNIGSPAQEIHDNVEYEEEDCYDEDAVSWSTEESEDE